MLSRWPLASVSTAGWVQHRARRVRSSGRAGTLPTERRGRQPVVRRAVAREQRLCRGCRLLLVHVLLCPLCGRHDRCGARLAAGCLGRPVIAPSGRPVVASLAVPYLRGRRGNIRLLRGCRDALAVHRTREVWGDVSHQGCPHHSHPAVIKRRRPPARVAATMPFLPKLRQHDIPQ